MLSVLLCAVTGCDLVSEMDGPRPEDFRVDEDAAEVRGEDDVDPHAAQSLRQGVGSPFPAARDGMTLSLHAQALGR